MNWRFWKREKRDNEIEYNPYGGLGLENILNLQVTPAISLSAVFAAVEIISNSVAELPINVKTTEENKVSVLKSHPLYHIFDNCLLTKYMLVKMLVSDMLLYGNGFAYIERAKDGTPINLIYCPHGTVTIQYNEMPMNK